MRAALARTVLLALLLAPRPGGAQTDPPPLVRPMGGVNSQAAALLAHGGGGGALRLQATALPVAYPDRAIPVLVVVELDGQSLLAGQTGGRLGVELTLYAVDATGSVAASRVEGIAVDLDRRGAELDAGGLRWLCSVALDPGEWSLRVLARVHRSSLFGLTEVRLRLPAPGTRGATFLAAHSPSAGAWIDAPSPALDPAASAAIAALGGPPAAMPVIGTDAPTRLWALVGGGDAGPLTARLTDGLGRPAGEPALTARGGQRLAEALTALDLEMAATGGEPGLRDLALSAREGALAAGPRRLIARPGAAPGPWTDLARVARTAEPVEATAASPQGPAQPELAPPATKRDLERFRAGYRTAYARFAAGDREGAVAALRTFEQETLAGERRRAMGWLDAADRRAVAELVEARPGTALPLALLYRDLFLAHLEAGRVGLAHRAEMRATELLERYAAAAVAADQRSLAAAAFESLAADLLSIEAPERAAEMLERATRLAPGHVRDWVALGAIYERERRLEPALSAFDRALALEPGQREARLRRARIEIVRGNLRRARELLDGLTAEPTADWIGVVAVQERVRLLLDEGALPRALTLLEAAVERFPGEPSIALALSYAYERSGRRADASAAAERALTGGAGFGVAPRKRYSAPPIEGLAASRAEVETAALLAANELAAALGNGRAGGVS